MARELFIRRRNRNFPRKRTCFCCELLCSWISYFQIILECPNCFNFISQTLRWPAIFGSRQACYCTDSESVTVGHLPKFMSKLAHFFVKHAGKIRCEITGSKRYTSDLEHGGLEITAKIIFQNSNKRIIEKWKRNLLLLSRNIIKNINCFTYM